MNENTPNRPWPKVPSFTIEADITFKVNVNFACTLSAFILDHAGDSTDKRLLAFAHEIDNKCDNRPEE